ncbi:hypothetical protein Hanom_Chr16g01417641 [Helianthus anomalus]
MHTCEKIHLQIKACISQTTLKINFFFHQGKIKLKINLNQKKLRRRPLTVLAILSFLKPFIYKPITSTIFTCHPKLVV